MPFRGSVRLEFHGDSLRLARVYRGLTLGEVGYAIGTQKQYVQQLEAGRKQPSAELREAIAAFLRFKPGFFLHALESRVLSEECFFRKLKSTPKQLSDRAAAFVTLYVSLIDFLDAKLGWPKVTLPSIPISLSDEIELAAARCRDSMGIPRNAPIKSMTRALEASGVPVATLTGMPREIDAFSWCKRRPIAVKTTLKGSTSRSRFDLAHECGHLILHRDVLPGDDEMERQASRFASALLLPADSFRREFPNSDPLNWSALLEIKRRWGVSVAAIVRRARDLALMDDLDYRKANVWFRQNRWHLGEPDEPPEESSEIVSRALKLLRDIYKVTDEDLATQLHLDRADLYSLAGVTPRPSMAPLAPSSDQAPF